MAEEGVKEKGFYKGFKIGKNEGYDEAMEKLRIKIMDLF